MRRREVVAALALVWVSGNVRAQGRKVPRLMILSPQGVSDMQAEGAPGFKAFFLELRRLGYLEGQNLMVERWSGEGRTDRYAALAREAVRSNPDVLLVQSARIVRHVKEATITIPVVAYTTDPVNNNLIESLAHPGGNITGVAADAGAEVVGKRLELLREAVPGLSRLGFLAPRGVWEGASGKAMVEAARQVAVALLGPPLDSPIDEAEYRRFFEAMSAAGADGFALSNAGELFKDRRIILELANHYQLPGISPDRMFAEEGGLISYGADLVSAYTRMARYVDQILKGVKPGEIPFYQQIAYELVINLKAAKALGLTIPQSLLARADEVIE